MAVADERTATDELADALDAVEAAEKQLHNWREYLEHALIDPAPGTLIGASRNAAVVTAEAGRAQALTMAAARRIIADPRHRIPGQVRSVS